MRDVKEKKCGCIHFEVGPPVLCEKHQFKQDKKAKREARQVEREQAREEKGLRRVVADSAAERGHDLSRFKEYPSVKGKWTAHCHNCGSIAIVYDKIPEFGDQVNAKALLEDCKRSSLVGTLADADRERVAERLRQAKRAEGSERDVESDDGPEADLPENHGVVDA